MAESLSPVVIEPQGPLGEKVQQLVSTDIVLGIDEIRTLVPHMLEIDKDHVKISGGEPEVEFIDLHDVDPEASAGTLAMKITAHGLHAERKIGPKNVVIDAQDLTIVVAEGNDGLRTQSIHVTNAKGEKSSYDGDGSPLSIIGHGEAGLMGSVLGGKGIRNELIKTMGLITLKGQPNPLFKTDETKSATFHLGRYNAQGLAAPDGQPGIKIGLTARRAR